MKANQFISQFGLDKAKDILSQLMASDGSQRFGVVRGMLHRTSDGFTYEELKTAVEAHGLIEFLGGLDVAKAKVEAAKGKYYCINVPYEDGFADVLVDSVEKALQVVQS